MSATPSNETDFDSMTYQQLRQECRRTNLSSSGKAEALRKRLQKHTEEQGVARLPRNHTEEEERKPKKQKKSPAADLVCPISLELPWDPVMAEDGRIYERSCIEEHFKNHSGHLKSPVTNQRMGKTLLPAVQHRNLIETWVENGEIGGDLAAKWNLQLEQQRTMNILLEKAESGDLNAMQRVALNYRKGTNGVKRDLKRAFKWFKKLHKAGVLVGTERVGEMLLSGFGVASCKSGLIYTTMAAEKGSAVAAFLLGVAFADGKHGIIKSKSDAIRWLKKAVTDGPHNNLSAKDKATAQDRLQALLHPNAAENSAGSNEQLTPQESTVEDAFAGLAATIIVRQVLRDSTRD